MEQVTWSEFTPPSSPAVSTPPPVDPFPIAAVVCGAIGLYLVGLVAFYVVLRSLSKKCKLQCVDCSCLACISCKDCCVKMAECTDCDIPSINACLDAVCPSKQQCLLWCGGCRQWCLVNCKLPDVSAFCNNCPSLRCWSCQCRLQMPDCSNLTCLCIQCGGGGR